MQAALKEYDDAALDGIKEVVGVEEVNQLDDKDRIALEGVVGVEPGEVMEDTTIKDVIFYDRIFNWYLYTINNSLIIKGKTRKEIIEYMMKEGLLGDTSSYSDRMLVGRKTENLWRKKSSMCGGKRSFHFLKKNGAIRAAALSLSC